MPNASKDYDALLAAAQKLAKDAATDTATAERLVKDPGKAIADAAGYALPKGVRVKLVPSADGKSVMIKAEVDPQYGGELDDKVLEAVSGGGEDKRNHQPSVRVGMNSGKPIWNQVFGRRP